MRGMQGAPGASSLITQLSNVNHTQVLVLQVVVSETRALPAANAASISPEGFPQRRGKRLQD